ncbi:MAG: LysM domain-containing protein [Myxococcota bacterium]
MPRATFPWSSGALGLLALTLTASPVAGFPHIVREGETLASVADAFYGRVEREQIIAVANGLDAGLGSTLVPGMRLEIPAVSYRKVSPGDTWASIAELLLGTERRADVLAHYNDTHAWVRPELGKEVLIPYALRHVATRGETTQSVAYRYLGKRDAAWIVASFNALRRARLRQGEVLLIPLDDLTLTVEGRREAKVADALVRSEGAGRARSAQRAAQTEIPRLVQDIRRGRWVMAIERAARLLGGGGLSDPQLATVHRQVMVAYTALDERVLAARSCRTWLSLDPRARLDPVEMSPKLMAVCADIAPAPDATGGSPQ